MDKIKIVRNTNGDTRVAQEVPTIKAFGESNIMHHEDVKSMMANIAKDIRERGIWHDITKLEEPNKSLFYRELCATIEGKMDFEAESEWYKRHCELERHHLNKKCPDDVNLIDVLEMICDCVCAGLARTGNFRPVEIPSEILQKAVENTAKMCVKAVELVD